MGNNQKNIAVIPARGGSKRLKNKNIKLLGNIPLLLHTINYAKQYTNLFYKIVVSTDDKSIKKIALENGVHVIDRPKELSGDLVPTVAVLKHVLETEREEDYDNIVLLQPTNPFRNENLLKEAWHLFNTLAIDSLMTVSENRQKFGTIDNNRFKPFNYKIGQRSQDMKPLYYENGLLYISKATLILQGEIIGDKVYPFIINHPLAKIDIDTADDFEMATYYYNKYYR